MSNLTTPTPTVLPFTVEIEIHGADAAAIAGALAQIAADGRLELPLLALLRAELGSQPGNWRIVRAVATPAGEVTS